MTRVRPPSRWFTAAQRPRVHTITALHFPLKVDTTHGCRGGLGREERVVDSTTSPGWTGFGARGTYGCGTRDEAGGWGVAHGIPNSNPPYLVLRDTLRSCEANGMTSRLSTGKAHIGPPSIKLQPQPAVVPGNSLSRGSSCRRKARWQDAFTAPQKPTMQLPGWYWGWRH